MPPILSTTLRRDFNRAITSLHPFPILDQAEGGLSLLSFAFAAYLFPFEYDDDDVFVRD